MIKYILFPLFFFMSKMSFGQTDIVLLNGHFVDGVHSFISSKDFSKIAIYGASLSEKLDGVFYSNDNGRMFRRYNNDEIPKINFGEYYNYWMTTDKHIVGIIKNKFIHYKNGEWNKPRIIYSNVDFGNIMKYEEKFVIFPNEKTGYIIFNNTADILKTFDGGRDWDQQKNIDDYFPKFAHFIQNAYFFDEKNGVIYGNRYSTTFKKNCSLTSDIKETKHNIDSFTIYEYQGYSFYGNCDTLRKFSNFLYYTKDGGDTWFEGGLPQEFSLGKLIRYGQFSFVSERVGFSFFRFPVKNGQSKILFSKTENGGKTWKLISSSIIEEKYNSFKNENKGLPYKRDESSFFPFVIHNFNDEYFVRTFQNKTK